MFTSIADDIKSSFDYGSMVTKLIIINIGAFMLTALLNAFLPTFYQTNILPYIALPGDGMTLLFRPWTMITHMFIHNGLWHLIWNMLTFYWFGNIAGDLLGDRRILPVYIIGGLCGAVAYLISFQLLANIGSYALGASAAVLAIVFTAVATAPEYRISLILLGEVRIKFIGLFILFFDIIGINASSNSGGHIAHLGGTLFGFLYVYLLRSGTDLSAHFNYFFNFFNRSKPIRQKYKNTLKIAHKADSVQQKTSRQHQNNTNLSTSVDAILDKIKQKGYDSLTDEEKEILFQASKN
jgi:membrane associated rhomboid family serine protease